MTDADPRAALAIRLAGAWHGVPAGVMLSLDDGEVVARNWLCAADAAQAHADAQTAAVIAEWREVLVREVRRFVAAEGDAIAAQQERDAERAANATLRAELAAAQDARVRAEREAERMREALSGLLADTQHAEHACADAGCPVRAARDALEGGR